MIRETFLQFWPASSPIHRADARIKLLALVILSTAAMLASPRGFAPLWTVAFAALYASRIPVLRLLSESRGVFYLVAGIFVASSLTGETIPSGLSSGALYSLRLLTLVTFGQLLIATTTVSEIRRAVARLLKPFPLRWASAVSTILSLSISFVSFPLHAASEARAATIARGFVPRRRPIRFITLIATTMTVRTLLDAEQRARAIEVRGGVSRTPPAPSSISPGSRFAFAVAVLASGLAVVL